MLKKPDDAKEVGFMLEMNDAAAFSSLFKQLSEVQHTVNLYVSKNGLTVTEILSNRQLSLHAEFPASSMRAFEFASSANEIVVCVRPAFIVDALGTCNAFSAIRLGYGARRNAPRVSGIDWTTGQHLEITRIQLDSQLTLTVAAGLDAPEERALNVARPTVVDHFLVFESADLLSILGPLCAMKDSFSAYPFMQIAVDAAGSTISFALGYNGGSTTGDIARCRTTKRVRPHDEVVQTIDGAPGSPPRNTTKAVEQEFSLSLLQHCSHFIRVCIDAQVEMMLSLNYPLMFRKNLGRGLGVLTLSIINHIEV